MKGKVLTGSKLYLPWVGFKLQFSTDLCMAISIFTCEKKLARKLTFSVSS